MFIVCFLPLTLVGRATFDKIKQLVRSLSDLTRCNISVLVVVIETVAVGGTGLEVRQEIATLSSRAAVHKRYRIKDLSVRTDR